MSGPDANDGCPATSRCRGCGQCTDHQRHTAWCPYQETAGP